MWVKIDNAKKLPSKQGVYVMYSKKDNKILYIGKAISLYNRFFNNGGECGHRNARYFYGIENIYIKYKITDSLFLESKLIAKLKPPFNMTYNSNAKRKSGLPRLCNNL